MEQVIRDVAFVPSGRRAIDTIADTVTGAKQPGGQALPQLLPPGLTPDEHVVGSIQTTHSVVGSIQTTHSVVVGSL